MNGFIKPMKSYRIVDYFICLLLVKKKLQLMLLLNTNSKSITIPLSSLEEFHFSICPSIYCSNSQSPHNLMKDILTSKWICRVLKTVHVKVKALVTSKFPACFT
uniref:Uncharacterized protein n=1 Tax=Glossina pallidipes TaxID=7398 RepID=A0A1A9Z4E6_GLOPL